MLAVGKFSPVKIFRNNVGTGWVGKSKTVPGGIFLYDPRPLHAGLFEGSSDLIGWTTLKITPEMIGKDIAVFTAIEVKTEIGRASPKQVNFISQVRKSGGISGVVCTPEQAIALIKQYLPN